MGNNKALRRAAIQLRSIAAGNPHVRLPTYLRKMGKTSQINTTIPYFKISKKLERD